MKREMKKTPKWYLYLVVFYALLGILDSIILFNQIRFLLPAFTILGVVWVLFNAGLLFYFKEKFENRSYILPTYYVGFFFIAYLLLTMVGSIEFAISLQLISSVIELGLAIYLIKT